MAKHIGAVSREVIDALHSKMENPELWRPRKTGLEEFDKVVRIMPGRIYSIEGVQKSAKTTLALHMAKALALNNMSKVLYIQCEESMFDMGVRILTSLTTSVDRNHVMDMVLSEDHFTELENAFDKTSKLGLYVEDKVFDTDKIFKLIDEVGANVCVIDYFQLMDDKIPNARSLPERLQEISMRIVRRKNSRPTVEGVAPLTVILIAQLNEDLKVNQTRQLGRDIDQAIRIVKTVDCISGGTIDGTIDIVADRGRIGHGGKCTLSFNGAHSRIGNALPPIEIEGNPFDKLTQVDDEEPPYAIDEEEISDE